VIQITSHDFFCGGPHATFLPNFVKISVEQLGVLASEGWWKAWQTSPKATRSYLWSKTKLEDARWASPWNVIFLSSVLWHCWLDNGKGIRAVKKLSVGLLVVMIWLELCMAYSSSWHHRFHHPLLQWTPANPGSPRKWPLKWGRESLCIILVTNIQIHTQTDKQTKWNHNFLGIGNHH